MLSLAMCQKAARAQSVDLDSVCSEAGGRLLDRYLAARALTSDSVRITTSNNIKLPSRLLRPDRLASRSLAVYDIHSELVRYATGIDSLRTVVAGVFIPQNGSSSEKILLESTEVMQIGSRNVGSSHSLVVVREVAPPSFWRSVAEPALVILGAAAIVALFFLIRS